MADNARLTCQPATHPTGRAKLDTAWQVRLSNYMDKPMDNIDTFQQLLNLSNLNFNFRWFGLCFPYICTKRSEINIQSLCASFYPSNFALINLVFGEKKIYERGMCKRSNKIIPSLTSNI